MITGRSLKKVTEVFGHSRVSGTFTREIVKALNHFGVKCDTKLRRFTNFSGLPRLGVVHIKYADKHGHWAVIYLLNSGNYMIYCPSGYVRNWVEYGCKHCIGEIVSFLTVY